MREYLLQIGFSETQHGYLEKDYGKFCIEANPADKYFFIYTDQSGDREGAPYEYLGDEKFQTLINVHIEYFK